MENEFTHRDIEIDLSRQQVSKALRQARDEGSLELVYTDTYDKPGSLRWYRLTETGEQAIIDGMASFHESLVTAIMQDVTDELVPEHHAREIAKDQFIELFSEETLQLARTKGDAQEHDWRRAARLFKELTDM